MKNISERVKKTLNQYIRVIKLLKTPSKEEFIAAVKIAGGGILLVGLVGYVVWSLFRIIIGF